MNVYYFLPLSIGSSYSNDRAVEMNTLNPQRILAFKYCPQLKGMMSS